MAFFKGITHFPIHFIINYFFGNLKFELSVMENFNLAIYFQDVDFLNRVLSVYNINQFIQIHCFF